MAPKLGDPLGQTIEERLRFETFLSDLATRLLNVEPEELDAAIQKSLKELAGVLGGEKCGIGQFSEDRRALIFTHGFAAPHVNEFLIGADLAPPLPYYTAELREGRQVVWPRLPDDLPEGAHGEVSYTETFGLKSNFTLPLKAGGDVLGVVGVDYYSAHRDWSPELRSRMELLASVYANALYRRRAADRLRKVHDLNRSVLASVASEIVVLDGAGRLVVANEAWRGSARQEGIPADLLSPGSDYLAATERAIAEGQLAGRENLDGLRAVIFGEKPSYRSTYSYSPPTGTHRHYLLTVSRRAGGDGAVLVHTDVTELEETRVELEKSLKEIEKLKDRLEAENVVLQQQVRHAQGFDEVVGTSAALGRVLSQAKQVAPTETPVLLLGETGTGKEIIARALHELSRRRDRSLVTINCAALPATLIESEVFGYEKGAFTGAHQRTLGRFEVAHGGTLLLDEIGELPLEVQAKLLRVLEKGELERLGSSTTIKVDVRLIAATNRDLECEVREGRFRDDLYYRLNVFPIVLPPLRERPEDIPVLVWHFITRKQANLGKKIKRVPDRLMNAFASYSWLGNVRELENVIERSLIMTSGATLATDPLFLQGAPARPADSGTNLAEMERVHIRAVLEECGWKISGRGNAADRLGLKRSTLQYRMTKLGIHRPVHGA